MKALLSIKLPAELGNLERLVKSVSDCAKTQGFDERKTGEIELATEQGFRDAFRYDFIFRSGHHFGYRRAKDRRAGNFLD
jgi:hypothetical protein